MNPVLLSALPIEIFGAVISFVSLEDIASLRLTCRDIASKATPGTFTTAVKQRKIYLTTKTLQSLVDVTRDSTYMATQIRDCTLAGVVDDSESRSQGRVTRSVSSGVQNGETFTQHARLLLQAFRNLKRHSAVGRLASLRLRVVIRTGDGTLIDPGDEDHPTAHVWETTWATARRVFRVVMAALSQSGLRVDNELDLFHGQIFCNLTCDVFAVGVGTFPWPDIFGSLQTIKANVSAPIRDYRAEAETSPEERHKRKEWGTLYKIAGDERATRLALQTLSSQSSHKFIQSILDLLHVLPELQKMDLCWREAEEIRDVPSMTGMNHLSPLPPPVIPPFVSHSPRHLSVCTLCGFQTSAANLLQFLRMTKPSSLTLRYIRIETGTFADIFNFLTDRDTDISSFFLDDLFEGDSLVNFDVPGPPKFDYIGEKGTPSTLSRQGEDTKLAIHYHLPTTEAEVSGDHWSWWHDMNRLYGPCDEL